MRTYNNTKEDFDYVKRVIENEEKHYESFKKAEKELYAAAEQGLI